MWGLGFGIQGLAVGFYDGLVDITAKPARHAITAVSLRSSSKFYFYCSSKHKLLAPMTWPRA